jgi:DNA primase catalytic subunit
MHTLTFFILFSKANFKLLYPDWPNLKQSQGQSQMPSFNSSNVQSDEQPSEGANPRRSIVYRVIKWGKHGFKRVKVAIQDKSAKWHTSRKAKAIDRKAKKEKRKAEKRLRAAIRKWRYHGGPNPFTGTIVKVNEADYADTAFLTLSPADEVLVTADTVDSSSENIAHDSLLKQLCLPDFQV